MDLKRTVGWVNNESKHDVLKLFVSAERAWILEKNGRDSVANAIQHKYFSVTMLCAYEADSSRLHKLYADYNQTKYKTKQKNSSKRHLIAIMNGSLLFLINKELTNKNFSSEKYFVVDYDLFTVTKTNSRL